VTPPSKQCMGDGHPTTVRLVPPGIDCPRPKSVAATTKLQLSYYRVTTDEEGKGNQKKLAVGLSPAWMVLGITLCALQKTQRRMLSLLL
jgi:hypothetical protein